MAAQGGPGPRPGTSQTEEVHGRQVKDAILELLALIVDSTVLMQYVCDSRGSLENLHAFCTQNDAWFTSHIRFDLGRACPHGGEAFAAHASLAWGAAYFGSVDLFRMFLSSGRSICPQEMNAFYAPGRTLLDMLVEKAHRCQRNDTHGFLQITQIVLEQPQVEADWVLRYRIKMCSPEGDEEM